MITIEGLGGNGSLWCTFRSPDVDFTGIPSDVTAYCSPAKMRVTAHAPFECLLPPVTAEAISFPVAFSSYGPRLAKVEVGSLKTINDSFGLPHPCEHSTVNGSLLYCGSEPIKAIPTFTVVQPNTTELQYFYHQDRTHALPLTGFATTMTIKKAYDRNGSKVALSLNSLNEDLWRANTALLAGWRYPIGSSIPSSDGYPSAGEWLYWAKPLPTRWDLGPCMAVRFQTSRPSRFLFDEDIAVEYHASSSYGKPEALGPFTGLGYTRAYASLHRSHRIISIQSLQPAHFRVLVETSQSDVVWGVWNPLKPLVTGVKPAVKSSRWITLQVLEPGLVLSSMTPSSLFSQFCEDSKKRASVLYRHSNSAIARSRAMGDVSGLDSNWIENLSQVKGAPSVFDFLLEGHKAVKCGNLAMARRALSSAYLAYSYVIAPGVRDSQDLSRNGEDVFRSFTKYRYSNERRRGMFSVKTPVLQTIADTSYFCTYHLCLKDDSFSTVWNALERLGLDPSANNLWDCIPFSFVVDWFIHIGPALDKISAYNNNVLVRDIRSRIETFKAQWPLSEDDLANEHLTDFSVSSPLIYSWYDRRIYSSLGSIDPFAGQSLDGLSVSQMAQGGALLSVYR